MWPTKNWMFNQRPKISPDLKSPCRDWSECWIPLVVCYSLRMKDGGLTPWWTYFTVPNMAECCFEICQSFFCYPWNLGKIFDCDCRCFSWVHVFHPRVPCGELNYKKQGALDRWSIPRNQFPGKSWGFGGSTNPFATPKWFVLLSIIFRESKSKYLSYRVWWKTWVWWYDREVRKILYWDSHVEMMARGFQFLRLATCVIHAHVSPIVQSIIFTWYVRTFLSPAQVCTIE